MKFILKIATAICLSAVIIAGVGVAVWLNVPHSNNVGSTQEVADSLPKTITDGTKGDTLRDVLCLRRERTVIRCIGTYTPSEDTIQAEVGDQTTPQIDPNTGDTYDMPTYTDADIQQMVKDRTGYRSYDVTVSSDGAFITESLGGLS
jgi:hypothetical protein